MLKKLLRVIREFILEKLAEKNPVFYIGSSETLPEPLTAEEESETIAMIETHEARQKLVEHNLRLVVYIARRFENTGADLEDLISIGTIGLIKAVGSFRADKGIKLATYASRCIENEILMMLRSDKRYKNTVYLSDKMDTDNEGNEFTLLDVLSVNEESVFLQAEQSILAKRLDKVMKTNLSDREYQILILRYGLNGNTPHTQLDTAKKFEISRSYVSRIETKALKKLRKVLRQQDF